MDSIKHDNSASVENCSIDLGCNTVCNSAGNVLRNTNVKTITLGCRFNYYESELEKIKVLSQDSNDEVIIVNTCSVTHEAERQSKQTVRRAIKNNPNAKIIVTGCAAKTSYDYFKELDGVNQIIQNNEKARFDTNALRKAGVQLFEDRTRAFLQIQNGCNHHCSYCIIPYTRGKSQSIPIDFIIEQVQYFCSINIKEIVLSGIDIMSYGEDFDDRLHLSDVIETILKQTSIQRLRISSIDPIGIDDRLFALFTQESRIMPNFHLSTQSGDNDVLKRMRRRHTREDVIRICNRILDVRSDVIFGSDFIVGFPSETNECYQNTAKLVDEANISMLHVFPFSPRQHTLAATMLQLPKNVIQSRAKDLRRIANEASKKAMIRQIHNTRSCIIEKCELNTSFGKTDNYLPIKINRVINAPCIADCKIIGFDATDNILVAEYISNDCISRD